MIKPDGVERGLVGEVILRLEKKGLKLVAIKFARLDEKTVMDQYREHVGKPFFPGLKSYIMSGPCIPMVWEGRDAIPVVRKVIGETNPAEANPGTIRGDLALETGKNVIHASDSSESAKREIAIHFRPADFVEYRRADASSLYEYQ
jgi:nucleoside-diphosphate kinase